MDTTELSRVLVAATEHLEPRPGFTAAVVRAGKRRRARTRIVITTGAAVVTTLAATSAYVLWPETNPSEVQMADPRLAQPTKGDLAGDRAFRTEAVRAWRDGLPRSWDADRGIFDDLRGQPHVYWAGTTPAGPAAVIMQQAYFHPHSNLSPSDFDRLSMVYGLVATDPADGKRKLVATQYDSVKDPSSGSYLFGPGDRTLLVVDFGTPLYLAVAPRQAADGRIVRDWQQIPVSDGVAIAQLPNGAPVTVAKVLPRDSVPAPDERDFSRLLHPVVASTYLMLSERAGDVTINGSEGITPPLWRGEGTARSVGGHGRVENPMQVWRESMDQAGMLDWSGGGMANGQWVVTAGLDDGRTAIVTERTMEVSHNTLFAVLLDAGGTFQRIVVGPSVNPAAPLPVRLRLPDGQGWVVADYGATLRYRTDANGPWQDAGRDAALLPDDAVQAQVTRDGNQTAVDLPR